MSQEKHFSDEFLNAFVDDQLDAEEKSRAYRAISQDDVLNQQVCELRKMRDLVQFAYRNPPPAPARDGHTRKRRAGLGFGMAASAFLVVGILIGSQVHLSGPASLSLAPATPDDVSRVAHAARKMHPATAVTVSHKSITVHPANPAEAPSQATTKQPRTEGTATPTGATPVFVAPPSSTAANKPQIQDTQSKVLVHLARDDDSQLSQALDDIEGLLQYYRASGQKSRVEVVVNGKGLELVRTDTSQFAGRIRQLQNEYDNLTFAACQNTIDRLQREEGITVRLLPGVITIDSGMAEIMRRQNQGWTYLQV
jgi:intracellular sulfur oxidation DsrE/DsrF family protein